MKIGGLQEVTLIDYPGRIACTVFILGCNFRCQFCYSPELVIPEKIKNQPRIKKADFFNFLKERKNLLEGVVICGGEPTINNDLPNFIREIKKYNYLVKLDTNGSNPSMLTKLIRMKLIDYIAMDIKAPKERYSQITGASLDVSRIERSIKILKESKIDYEFRTTMIPGLLREEDILKIARWIGPGGKYFLQNFRPEKTLNPEFKRIHPYNEDYLLEIKKAIEPFFDVCRIRGI